MSANTKKFKAMSTDERFVFMATAARVTIGDIWQIEDFEKKTLRHWYVAKVRGIVVSDDGKYKFDTAEQALEFGRSILDGWKKELSGRVSQKTESNNDSLEMLSALNGWRCKA